MTFKVCGQAKDAQIRIDLKQLSARLDSALFADFHINKRDIYALLSDEMHRATDVVADAKHANLVVSDQPIGKQLSNDSVIVDDEDSKRW